MRPPAGKNGLPGTRPGGPGGGAAKARAQAAAPPSVTASFPSAPPPRTEDMGTGEHAAPIPQTSTLPVGEVEATTSALGLDLVQHKGTVVTVGLPADAEPSVDASANECEGGQEGPIFFVCASLYSSSMFLPAPDSIGWARLFASFLFVLHPPPPRVHFFSGGLHFFA